MVTHPFDNIAETPKGERREQPAESLARISASLHTIAAVLAAYPSRNPATWKSPEWSKELKDLQIACERLQEYARKVEEISARLANGGGGPR